MIFGGMLLSSVKFLLMAISCYGRRTRHTYPGLAD